VTITKQNNSILLEVEHLSKSFKGLKAVHNYHLELRQGEIMAIIGPNGAGKTTIFNLLTGHIPPSTGKVWFTGQEITHLLPNRIAHLGIGRTFQNIRLFSSMSVLENVMTAQQLHHPYSLIAMALNLPSFVSREKLLMQESLDQLALFELDGQANTPANALSYGDQRRLEIVRALALRPKLLLLDEPTAGMNLHESTNILHLIRRIRDQYDLTIIIVEHNMPLVMKLCERLQVLSYGEILADGTPDQIRNNPEVIEAYLGREETDVKL
jgi:branched-chain amino acid transport system ATP-binding protein